MLLMCIALVACLACLLVLVFSPPRSKTGLMNFLTLTMLVFIATGYLIVTRFS